MWYYISIFMKDNIDIIILLDNLGYDFKWDNIIYAGIWHCKVY